MMEITQKQIEKQSKEALIAENPKEKPFNVFTTNNTIFDRTYPSPFTDENGLRFNSIAHYVAYHRVLYYNLSEMACSEIRSSFKTTYPTTKNLDSLPYEDEFFEKYALEMSKVPKDCRFSWRNECVKYAVRAIVFLAQHNSEFRVALLESGDEIFAEDSGSMLWGAGVSDEKDIPYPKRWNGDNAYGQALMVARGALKYEGKGIFNWLHRKIF